jgi:hypothetical protein
MPEGWDFPTSRLHEAVRNWYDEKIGIRELFAILGDSTIYGQKPPGDSVQLNLLTDAEGGVWLPMWSDKSLVPAEYFWSATGAHVYDETLRLIANTVPNVQGILLDFGYRPQDAFTFHRSVAGVQP